jgi:hypothetical protein
LSSVRDGGNLGRRLDGVVTSSRQRIARRTMADWNEQNVRHLLSRAGFGAKPNDIKNFLRKGQLLTVATLVGQTPSKSMGPGVSDVDADSLAALRKWWIRRMVKQGNRRLQEKMVLFWHDHFATQYSVVKKSGWRSRTAPSASTASTRSRRSSTPSPATARCSSCSTARRTRPTT